MLDYCKMKTKQEQGWYTHAGLHIVQFQHNVIRTNL